jgi:dynactin complex subunit
MKGKKTTIPVSERTLIQRVNREIGKTHRRVIKVRSAEARIITGDYYILNTYTGTVDKLNENLEKLGRQLKVLRTHEHLVKPKPRMKQR